MRKSRPRCDACGHGVLGDLVHLLIEGRRLQLCAAHAARLGSPLPTTLAEAAAALGCMALERRLLGDRRGRFDRRMFPRPESRRMGDGRRRVDA